MGRLRELIRQGEENVKLKIRAESAERWTKIYDRALIWQSLVPAWTLPLACECGFPTDGVDCIEQIFRKMEAIGACQARLPANSLPEETPWLNYMTPVETRNEILQTLLDTKKYNPSFFRREAGEIARRILLAKNTLNNGKARKIYDSVLPENILIWARIAKKAQNLSTFVVWFNSLTKNLIEGGKSGELSRWIDAARSLEELFGAEFGFAVARAVRQLELFHRRAEDERHLTKFLERDEQIAAFDRLLESNSHWALHYIGVGGVGKTMLIRHITAKLSKARGSSVARVDFDYLNPDYPARAPGLLLAYLAEEFRAYSPNQSAVDLLLKVNQKIADLHDVIKVKQENLLLKEILEPIFTEILPHFSAALRLLPTPLVILDTCEELLKIRVDGSTPPSLAATFMIIERLRDQNQPDTYVPDLRVIFSGRRPLASAGAGWRIANLDLPAKSYLSIHIIRGFTRGEAQQYLEEKEKLRDLRPDAVEQIIENSIEQIKIKNIRFDSSEEHFAGQRYNPFDLWLYASWLHEDKHLSLDTLQEANSDRYVELRTVQRQTNTKLHDLIPFVALLGRFDAANLQKISGFEDEIEFKKLYVELGNLEWISWQAGQILEVDRPLQPRLLAYFENRKTENYRHARRKTVNYLENFTLGAKYVELDKTYFVVTYKLLKNEPERALRWWENIEQRFASEQRADWLKEICESILGSETEEAPLTEKMNTLDSAVAQLLAAVHISYAAAMRQTRSFGEIEQILAQAILLLKIHGETVPKDLSLRAVAGQILAAAQLNSHNVKDEQIKLFWRSLAEVDIVNFQTAGSLVAAAEAIIELLENESRNFVLDTAGIENLITVLVKIPDCERLLFFAKSLYARSLILTGKQTKGCNKLRNLLRDEEAEISSMSVISPPQIFLDWLAPSHLIARIKAEFIRFAYPTYGAKEILEIVGDEIPDPNSIDADRLSSAILQLRGAIGLPSVGDAEIFISEIRFSSQQEATVNVHRAFPPFFAVYAEAIAAAGRVDEAIKMLREKSLASEVSNFSELETTHEADRACLRIARRMRLRDERITVTTSISTSVGLPDAELVWTNKAVSNPERETNFNFDSYFGSMKSRDVLPALIHARKGCTK